MKFRGTGWVSTFWKPWVTRTNSFEIATSFDQVIKVRNFEITKISQYNKIFINTILSIT